MERSHIAAFAIGLACGISVLKSNGSFSISSGPIESINLLSGRSFPVTCESTGVANLAFERPGWSNIYVWSGSDKEAGKFSKHIPAKDNSQVGQSSTVIFLLGSALKKGDRPRYFLDLAANDAIRLSNTIMLERDYGWEGLCIEGNARYWEELAKRKCAIIGAAIGGTDNDAVTFRYDEEFGGIADRLVIQRKQQKPTIVKKRTVKLGTVLKLMQAPKTIDYWSLDVEGAEMLIAEAFPWANYSVSLLTVERPGEPLAKLLYANGMRYMCDHGTFGDQMWCAVDLCPKFAEKFRVGGYPAPPLHAEKEWGAARGSCMIKKPAKNKFNEWASEHGFWTS